MPHYGPTAWQGSTRRRTLPPDWENRRLAVKHRANGRCEAPGWLPGRVVHLGGPACHNAGTDCDHIGDPADHELSNLQWLCHEHHVRKSLRDQRTRRVTEKRPRERHPGLRG